MSLAIEIAGEPVAAIEKSAIAVGPQRHEPRANVPMRGARRVDVGAEREAAAEKAVDPLHPVNVGEPIGGGAGARAAGGEQEGRAAGRTGELARVAGGGRRRALLQHATGSVDRTAKGG